MTANKEQYIGFRVSDVVEHFEELKNLNTEKWWKNNVIIEWDKVRPSTKTKWISIRYRKNSTDYPAKLNVIVMNELHIGQIQPVTAEDVADLKNKNPEARVTQRTMKPCIQVQRWSTIVPTLEDRITPVFDNNKQVLPDEKFRSKYFQFAEYMDEIFKTEIEERANRSLDLMLNQINSKNKEKTSIDTLEAVAQIRINIGHLHDGDTIIQESDYIKLKEKFPNTFAELTKGFIQVSSTKVFPIIQEFISPKAIKNKGIKLPNPLTRITIPFDLLTNAATAVILDKSIPSIIGNKKIFNPAKVDDEPVNALNVHKFILSRSKFDGIVCMDSICLSSLGISIPTKFTTLIIMPPIKREGNSITDICDGIYGNDGIPTEPSTRNIITPATTEEDDLLDELTN
jgi:hypothetical protein